MKIIGIDPDSKKHGIAIYESGKLIDLRMMKRAEVVMLARESECIVSLEDVMANQFIYTRNIKQSMKVQATVAMHIGRCQQSMVELEEDLLAAGAKIIKHKPNKGNWAKKRGYFERITGWEGQSNEDTRSAAFFGYLEARKSK